MDWGGPEFVIAIIAISTAGWLISSWIRARHGYALENEWSGTTDKRDPEAERRIASLSSENAQLRAEMGSMKDRLATLERIVTDDGHRLTQEIESLHISKN